MLDNGVTVTMNSILKANLFKKLVVEIMVLSSNKAKCKLGQSAASQIVLLPPKYKDGNMRFSVVFFLTFECMIIKLVMLFSQLFYSRKSQPWRNGIN